MNKKSIFKLCIIMLCLTLTGCQKENSNQSVTMDDLKSIKETISNKIAQKNKSQYENYSNLNFYYIDEKNKTIIVELVNNTEEDQNYFKNNIINSSFVTFSDAKSTPETNIIGKTLVKTYNLRNIEDSNDENFIWLTLRAYQEEEVSTVRVSKKLAENLKIKQNYEFTFQINSNNLNENEIFSVFNDATLQKIEKTDKVGLDQTNGIITNN